MHKIQNLQEKNTVRKEIDRQQRHEEEDKCAWKCPLCTFRREGRQGRRYVLSHITQKHEDNTPPMPEHTEQNNTTCLLCNITYKAKSGYHSHMRNKHPIVYQAPTRQPIKIMLNASLQSQSNLLRPQTTQSTSQQIPQQPNTAMTNQLQCRACQRICKSKAGYRPHQS